MSLHTMEVQLDKNIDTDQSSEVKNAGLNTHNICRSPATPTMSDNRTNKPGGDISESDSEVTQDNNEETVHLGAATNIPATRLLSSGDEDDASFDDLSEGSVPEFRGQSGVRGGR